MNGAKKEVVLVNEKLKQTTERLEKCVEITSKLWQKTKIHALKQKKHEKSLKDASKKLEIMKTAGMKLRKNFSVQIQKLNKDLTLSSKKQQDLTLSKQVLKEEQQDLSKEIVAICDVVNKTDEHFHDQIGTLQKNIGEYQKHLRKNKQAIKNIATSFDALKDGCENNVQKVSSKRNNFNFKIFLSVIQFFQLII
jgi:chromosome segregation ATPase